MTSSLPLEFDENILNTISTTTQRKIKYKFNEGAIIRDKTDRIAKVSLWENLVEKESQHLYKITLFNKNLIFPVALSPSDTTYFALADSKKITIEAFGTLFIITEVDKYNEVNKYGKNVFYVDTSEDVKGVDYKIYDYMPEDVSKEKATLKFSHLKDEFPDFKADFAVYNRHGVGVFGYDDKKSAYAFYRARPCDEKVKQEDCFEIGHCRDSNKLYAKSSDLFASFLYDSSSETCHLNGEPAERISIES